MAATNTHFKLLEHAVGDAWLSTIQLRTAEDFSRYAVTLAWTMEMARRVHSLVLLGCICVIVLPARSRLPHFLLRCWLLTRCSSTSEAATAVGAKAGCSLSGHDAC